MGIMYGIELVNLTFQQILAITLATELYFVLYDTSHVITD